MDSTSSRITTIWCSFSTRSPSSQTSRKKPYVRCCVGRFACRRTTTRVHIKGVEDHWADLIGRWTQPETIRRLVQIPVLPTTSSDDFVWPTAAELAIVQEDNRDSLPSSLNQNKDESLWRTAKGAIWIPDNADGAQLRLCVVAHTGPSGHHGYKTSLRILRTRCTWSTDSDDMSTFVKACLHCLSTTGVERSLVRSDRHSMAQSLTIYCNSITSKSLLAPMPRNTCSCCAMTTPTTSGFSCKIQRTRKTWRSR